MLFLGSFVIITVLFCKDLIACFFRRPENFCGFFRSEPSLFDRIRFARFCRKKSTKAVQNNQKTPNLRGLFTLQYLGICRLSLKKIHTLEINLILKYSCTYLFILLYIFFYTFTLVFFQRCLCSEFIILISSSD